MVRASFTSVLKRLSRQAKSRPHGIIRTIILYECRNGEHLDCSEGFYSSVAGCFYVCVCACHRKGVYHD